MSEFDSITGELLPQGKPPQIPPAAVFKFIPDMDDDQLRKLSREKLSKALQAIDPIEQPAMTLKLCAEMKDRLDGKPGQAIDITGKIGIVQLVLEAGKREKQLPLIDNDIAITEK